jgi:hypothetical protein
MVKEKLPNKSFEKLRHSIKKEFNDESSWLLWLEGLEVFKPRHIKTATEAALFGGLIKSGLNKDLIILSDDAGQFNIPGLTHSLCWVHEIRHIKNLVPISDSGRIAQKEALESIWNFYSELKNYRSNPTKAKKVAIDIKFEEIFLISTSFACLNIAMKRIYNKKEELLVFIKAPSLPLHNNGSEGDIREFVKRRKISGGTRSTSGQQGRDTFTSLKKTCRKLGISFWQYLKVRLSNTNAIERLPLLIEKKAALNRFHNANFASEVSAI